MVCCANRVCQGDRAQLARLLLQRVGAIVPPEPVFRSGGLGQPAGVIEQVAHGDLCGRGFVCYSKPGKIALHGGVEVNLPGFGELHDGQPGHRFCQGGKIDRRLRCHRPPVWGGDAETLHVHDLIAVHDGERHAGDARVLHLRLDVGIDGGKIGRIGGAVPGRQGDDGGSASCTYERRRDDEKQKAEGDTF